jgi:hypothetical protein
MSVKRTRNHDDMALSAEVAAILPGATGKARHVIASQPRATGSIICACGGFKGKHALECHLCRNKRQREASAKARANGHKSSGFLPSHEAHEVAGRNAINVSAVSTSRAHRGVGEARSPQPWKRRVLMSDGSWEERED